MGDRWDETWHRLREWTNGQGPAERLSAQILKHEGFTGIEPSHPLGGPDGGKDALCYKDEKKCVMAVYFPRGEQDFTTIKRKLTMDLKGVAKNGASEMAFVTNQELRLAEKSELKKLAAPLGLDLYDLERLTLILDCPEMSLVRRQFLNIEPDDSSVILYQRRLKAADTLWESWLSFWKHAPTVLGVLDWITYEEEKRMNRIPAIQIFLKGLDMNILPKWIEATEFADKTRPVLGEDTWLTYFNSRAVFGRIVTHLIFEKSKSPMLPWRDADRIHDLLGDLCTEEEISSALAREPGRVSFLRETLQAKILAKTSVIQDIRQKR